MLRVIKYSSEELTTRVLYEDIPSVVRGCIASGGMPEITSEQQYEDQLCNLLITLRDCDVFVVYANTAPVAFCATYVVNTDPHCAGTGLICAVTMSTGKFPRAIPLLFKHIREYCVLSSYDWWYTSKKIDAYTYQGKYNLLRRT